MHHHGLFAPLRRLVVASLAGWLGFVACVGADTTLIPAGATWKYLANGSDQGSAWRAAGFDDSAWSAGPSEFGYGDGDEATVVSYGPVATSKYVTTYFRKTLAVANPAAFTALKLRILRDDGVVVYLNGTEIRRDNMPAGAVTAATLASSQLGAPAEATFYETMLSPSAFVAGNNTLAIELHQGGVNSSDLSLNVELIGLTAVSVTRGPYLQKAAPDRMTIRWRTSAPTDSRVRYGLSASALTSTADDAALTTEHEVTLAGLSPDTQYFYGIGSTVSNLATASDFTFFTPPAVGTRGAYRFWAFGDAGTGDANQANVFRAYTNFTGTRYTDGLLALGDNAYDAGTDPEYQAKFFNVYSSVLRQSAVWSTVGNHETAQSANPSLSIPYFQNFSFPTAGESGGVASGTEKYYSFDYGNIHFICLDAMSSSRAAGSPMLTWLQSDLASTLQDWIVAFWHHPPYTKGSHNSDTEIELIEMRQNALPILEAGGVDLVLCGHSHLYERSWLIDGHYGLSTTFNPSTMLLDGGDGRETGAGPYRKPDGLSANQGAVYVVAGSSGKLSSWNSGSTADLNPAPHPVMYASYRRLGAMVIDVDGLRMDVKFLRDTGAVDDQFTMVKDVSNAAPSVALTSPAGGSLFTAPATLTLAATAADTDGTIAQVDFYANGTAVGSDATAPYSVVWSGAAAGTYVLEAVAIDDRGASAASAGVTISVVASVPSAPTGLTATPGATSIGLAWAASAGATSYTVKRGTTSGGPYTALATGVAATSFTDASATPGVAYFYVVAAVNGSGESANSTQASAMIAVSTTPAAPTGLVLGGITRTAMTLTWTDASSNETGFKIERSANGGTFRQIATVGANVRTYNSILLKRNTTYSYRVRAYNASGNSGYSNTATAKTLK